MNAPDGEPGNPAHVLFERFVRASQCREALGVFQELRQCLELQGTGLPLYRGLRASLNSWSAKALWSKLDKKASHKDYEQGTACARTKCLVVGAGPCGLRTAIELALLGARVVLVEKRDSFSRNNVLHLWPFTIHDLRALGAKKFYGRFCTGMLDHISIRQLQLILLKVALLLGVEVHVNVQFKGVLPPADKAGGREGGWRAVLQPSSSPLSHYAFDVLISAGGGKFVPEGFKRKETRGKLAIGITTNFVNRHSRAEVEVAEISGVARIYNQKFFQNLYNKTGIDLENIVYYKDDTHYFVMTAKKQSLLKMGVILQDKPDTESLLAADNVNREALLSYAKEAANFSTNYCLPKLEFALNHRGLPDVDVFDFTCMTRSENAALVREHDGARLLLGLVGDCLVEETCSLRQSGRERMAWEGTVTGLRPALSPVPRESIYQHLSQTSPDNTNKNVSQYSIDPTTRYPNINLQAIKPSQVQDLYLVGMVEVDHKGKSDNRLSTVAGDTYEELLSWCRASTAGYRGVEVADFTRSWSSGRALCALVHRFRPDLVDLDSIDQLDPLRRHQAMLDTAEQELGIQPVLSSAEMASMSEPSRLGLITYLSQFYEAFKPPPGSEDVAKKPLSTHSTKGAILFLSKLQKSRSLTLKRAQDSAQKDAEPKRSRREAEPDPGPDGDVWDGGHKQPATAAADPGQPSAARGESSDACYFCGRRVYIVERVSAEGRFFHRGCFQCRQCGATLRLGDYAFDEEDGHFYCSLHYPNPPGMELPPDELPVLPDGDIATSNPPPDTGSPCAAPEEAAPAQPGLPSTPVPPPAALRESPPAQPGGAEDAAGPEEQDAPAWPDPGLGAEEAKEEQGPGAEPRGAAEEDEESGGRRKIILTPLEKLKLSTLSLTVDAEPEPPPKPARLRLGAAHVALRALQPGQGGWEEEEEEMAEEEASEESDSEEEEEEGLDLGTMAESCLILEEPEKYPTWKRTLDRQAREAQMKRFCKAQAIQRRLEEIEVTFQELEKQGIKLEKFLREEAGTPADLKTQWMNQLLYLVQKKNSLVSEESDLMIAVQELKLQEQQCQLDQRLRQYMNKEEALKTPEERAAEREILAQLLEVVNKRNALIHVQEEKRLSELQA
ncbi:F-actin-monooxygenase MICAL1 isoform X2 [Struthio camelus]|uniref:F-actin-monooxygenase MICAL1 isoform X2 n=1 Tax=Struthio camelus TaxID=8801 RepID=UPI003603F629